MIKFKDLNPIQESILRMGKPKREINEDFDVNHPIGTLPYADAVATEQHINDRKAGLERLANPAKDPIVKEIIDETASEKSRTLHYDIVDRKGLSFVLTEAKKNNQTFKVGRSDKKGYRYRVDISPVLVEDINDKKDIKQDLDDYIKWCKYNNKKPEDSKSLEEFTKNTPTLKEAYKTPINNSDEYINAMYKAYKELKKRKKGYAAVYGYMKDKEFTPLLTIKDSQTELNTLVKGLKTREKGKTDVTVYTLFKNNLDGAEEMLKEKGLLKEELREDFRGNYDILLDDILNWFDDHEQAKEDIILYLKDCNYRDEDIDYLFKPDLDEAFHLYTSSLKDFKPAKQAKDLWDEIIEKDKLGDLEYELENVFKAEDEENASMDVEGLNDLLINHPDFIRTLINLDDEEDDEEFTEEPIDNMDLVIEDEDDEEPLEDLEIEDEYEEEDDEDIEVFEEESEDDEDEKANKEKKVALDKRFNESFIDINEDFDENISIIDHEEPKPENVDIEDTITEKIAGEFIKKRKEIGPEELNENKPLLLPKEDEEEIIDVNDEEINEALGMPSNSKEVK